MGNAVNGIRSINASVPSSDVPPAGFYLIVFADAKTQSGNLDPNVEPNQIAYVSLKQPKPVYKGPPPKPNRYGLRPGYRWDGTDRGNGFEDKVLEALHSKGRKKEEAYKWSAADM